MNKIEITTGMKTIVYRLVNTSETCPESYRVSYQSFRYTEDWELAEIRKLQSQLNDTIEYIELILDDDRALNSVINARTWSQ